MDEKDVCLKDDNGIQKQMNNVVNENENEEKHEIFGESIPEDTQTNDIAEEKPIDRPLEVIVTDIFGESDDEDLIHVVSDDNEFILDEVQNNDEIVVCEQTKSNDKSSNARENDIEYLLNRNKKYRNQRRRRNYDLLDNKDDYVLKTLNLMMEASNKDRKSNKEGKICLEKMKLLSRMSVELLRPELTESFIEQGIFQAFSAWLQPLPDGSLPSLSIRNKILKLIVEIPAPSTNELKISGLGKVISLLSRHPNECLNNRKIAKMLIDKWIRPIYGLEETHESYTRNKAKHVKVSNEIVHQHMPSMIDQTGATNTDKTSDNTPKPGDVKFAMRARVPQPSVREYKNRPVNVPIVNKSILYSHMKNAEFTTKMFKRCVRRNFARN